MSSAEQELLSNAAITSFRLNGQFLAVAEQLAAPSGLTAARWQALGAVLSAPATVSEIARTMGITRQSVQRIADLLVDQELAEYQPNPAHQRAKLLSSTDAGRDAVARIGPGHAAYARLLAENLGEERLRDAVELMGVLSRALDELGLPDQASAQNR
ncbi:MarR family winged helix-turn-helix transcriptional regulator [Nocardioides albus]|uniref:DNA-binding MarR family transcriptional regulator n=1 Tax=Nocardioides albus TaxID=1841 RepID=A0A7W5A9W4_9ACTN|nr:MarR family winged helix-turn-helix transcriptional regulator [Nocardioides albus]MBB3091889.1 DNA-binding MarR family transcriptional regulator [Nocardioides albus]GGU33008.1 MarR family transcriptional regulator [Nocardioides albus]